MKGERKKRKYWQSYGGPEIFIARLLGVVYSVSWQKVKNPTVLWRTWVAFIIVCLPTNSRCQTMFTSRNHPRRSIEKARQPGRIPHREDCTRHSISVRILPEENQQNP